MKLVLALEEHSVISSHAHRDAGIWRPVEHRRAQPEYISLSALFLAVLVQDTLGCPRKESRRDLGFIFFKESDRLTAGLPMPIFKVCRILSLIRSGKCDSTGCQAHLCSRVCRCQESPRPPLPKRVDVGPLTDWHITFS